MQEMQVQFLGWKRPPGKGNGNPLQYSCLGNPMDRGAWWAIGHGIAIVGHDLELSLWHKLTQYVKQLPSN